MSTIPTQINVPAKHDEWNEKKIFVIYSWKQSSTVLNSRIIKQNNHYQHLKLSCMKIIARLSTNDFGDMYTGDLILS